MSKLNKLKTLNASVGISRIDPVESAVWQCVWDSVNLTVGVEVRTSVYDIVGNTTYESLKNSIREHMWSLNQFNKL